MDSPCRANRAGLNTTYGWRCNKGHNFKCLCATALQNIGQGKGAMGVIQVVDINRT